jgi:hypothetical protein
MSAGFARLVRERRQRSFRRHPGQTGCPQRKVNRRADINPNDVEDVQVL